MARSASRCPRLMEAGMMSRLEPLTQSPPDPIQPRDYGGLLRRFTFGKQSPGTRGVGRLDEAGLQFAEGRHLHRLDEAAARRRISLWLNILLSFSPIRPRAKRLSTTIGTT